MVPLKFRNSTKNQKYLKHLTLENFALLAGVVGFILISRGEPGPDLNKIFARLNLDHVNPVNAAIFEEMGFEKVVDSESRVSAFCGNCTLADLVEIERRRRELGVNNDSHLSVTVEGDARILMVVQDELDKIGAEYSCTKEWEGAHSLFQCEVLPGRNAR